MTVNFLPSRLRFVDLDDGRIDTDVVRDRREAAPLL